MERRLTVILISDIVGYTKLMEEDTEGTVAAWSDARDKVVEPQVESANGRLVKFMGDGFLAEFTTVQTALECAIAIQNGVKENKLKFRMAVHLGDIIDDGKDIYGEGINIASRLEGIAEPGGICISGDVFNQVQNRIPAVYEDIGPQEVKNVAKPIQAYAVRYEDMPGAGKTNANSSEAGMPSIAVLPFDNMSGDPEQEYFTDGIVEDIITELSFIKNLRVIARNSSFTYKGKPIDIRKVGDELDVGYVLEGSVRKVGNDVRITAQLILTSDNSHRWAKRYDGTLENIFKLQTEISQKIAEELDVEFSSTTEVSVGEDSIKRKEAHDIARRGRAVMIPPNARNIEASKRFYHRAIEIDPNCALAFAGLGHADIVSAWHHEFEPRARDKYFKSGTELALKAREIDPKIALSYVSLTVSFLLQDNAEQALEISKRGIEQCPNTPEAFMGFGLINTALGNFVEALESIKKGIDLDPLHRTNYLVLINYHYAMQNYKEVIAVFEREFGDALIIDLPPYDWSIILCSYIKEEDHKAAANLLVDLKKAYPEFSAKNLKVAGSILPRNIFSDLVATLEKY